MKIEIRQVSNGFILNRNGEEYIAGTLIDAARLAGEQIPMNVLTQYTFGYTANDLIQIRTEAKAGNKINAIKMLRDCFTPRLGLREAKEIIENLCI